MTRYVARRPKAKHVEENTELDGEKYLARDVHEREPYDTGLVNKDGTPIFAEMEPIGFVRHNSGD